MINKIYYKNNLMLWCSFLFVIVGGVIGYYALAQQMVLLRLIYCLVTISLLLVILFKTKFGDKLYIYWNDAIFELRKVVWPTKKQTIQSTLAVLAMVFITAILLWALDAVFIKIIAKIIGNSTEG